MLHRPRRVKVKDVEVWLMLAGQGFESSFKV